MKSSLSSHFPLLFLSTLLLPVAFSRQTPLQIADRPAARALHASHFSPDLTRASVQNTAICPNNRNRTCARDRLCCPDECCPRNEPRCTASGHCVDVNSRATCTRRSDGEKFTGTTCAADPEGTCCGGNPDYPYCSSSAPFECLNSEGYISCAGSPGVSCGDSKCCENPQRCCEDGLCRTTCPGGPRERQSDSPTLDIAQVPVGRPSPFGNPKPFTGSNPACFPAGAHVEVRGGGIVGVEEVRIGDWVRVGAESFSEVFMWTHRDAEYEGDAYFELRMGDEGVFTAADGHVVYVCREGRKGCDREAVEVGDVRVGDGVWVVRGDQEEVNVVRETVRVANKGLYNPQTVHGDIVVNGVVSTCYTRFVPIRVAHSALASLRGLYLLMHSAFGTKIDLY